MRENCASKSVHPGLPAREWRAPREVHRAARSKPGREGTSLAAKYCHRVSPGLRHFPESFQPRDWRTEICRYGRRQLPPTEDFRRSPATRRIAVQALRIGIPSLLPSALLSLSADYEVAVELTSWWRVKLVNLPAIEH